MQSLCTYWETAAALPPRKRDWLYSSRSKMSYQSMQRPLVDVISTGDTPHLHVTSINLLQSTCNLPPVAIARVVTDEDVVVVVHTPDVVDRGCHVLQSSWDLGPLHIPLYQQGDTEEGSYSKNQLHDC